MSGRYVMKITRLNMQVLGRALLSIELPPVGRLIIVQIFRRAKRPFCRSELLVFIKSSGILIPLDEKSHGMERNHTCQEVQRIFRPDFNFARCDRSQYFIADLFPTFLPTLNGLNDKPVMSKPAQLTKLIELRKDLRREGQNRWYRSRSQPRFPLPVGLAAGVGAHELGASASGS